MRLIILSVLLLFGLPGIQAEESVDRQLQVQIGTSGSFSIHLKGNQRIGRIDAPGFAVDPLHEVVSDITLNGAHERIVAIYARAISKGVHLVTVEVLNRLNNNVMVVDHVVRFSVLVTD